MRPRTLPLVVALLAAATPLRADEPEVISLAVGEETKDLGIMPRCDDLSIVAVKANGRGVRATRPGSTLCSFDRSGGGGIRRVVRIEVSAPPPGSAPQEPGARRQGG